MNKTSLCIVLCLAFAGNGGAAFAEDCISASKIAEEAIKQAKSDASSAERKLKEAISLCDGSAALRYNLAMLYFKGLYDEAEKTLKAVIDKNSKFGRAYDLLAQNELEKIHGNPLIAVGYAKKAVEIDPGSEQFKKTLAFALDPKYPPVLSLEATINDQNQNGMIDGGETASLSVKINTAGRGRQNSCGSSQNLTSLYLAWRWRKI